jgi:hypothetical protein
VVCRLRAVAGLAFFVGCSNSSSGWRAGQPRAHWARVASVVVGMIFVTCLAELILIDAIRISSYCTGLYIVSLLPFGPIMTSALSGVKPLRTRQ